MGKLMGKLMATNLSHVALHVGASPWEPTAGFDKNKNTSCLIIIVCHEPILRYPIYILGQIHILYICIYIIYIYIYIYIKYWLEISKVYHHPSNPHWLTTESLQVTVSLRHCHHYKASLKRGTTHGLWDPWLLYHHGIFYDFLTQTLEFRSRISTSMPVSKWLIYSR